MPIISRQELTVILPALVLMIGYHVYLYIQVRRTPMRTSIGLTNHARSIWVKNVMADKRDILAIQTIRNQVMAANFLASTAMLISLGAFGGAFRTDIFAEISHALNVFGTRAQSLWMLKLMLLGIVFFFAFFNFTLAIRYYNHTGFMINTHDPGDPVGSAQLVTQVLNHGALHYFFGMRSYYLSIPLSLWLFGPLWFLAGSVIMVIALCTLDREP